MTDPIFDHDQLDVHRLSVGYTALAFGKGVADYEHRDAEHEHKSEKPTFSICRTEFP